MITDAELIAYADGSLDDDRRAAVEAAIAGDPALAAQLAEHQALRRRVGGAFAGVLEEPVPDRLRAMLEERAEVVAPDFRSRPKPHLAPAARWVALAASLVIGVAVGYGLAGQGGMLRPGEDGLQASGGLARALDQQLSSDVGGPIKVGLTFATASGEVCRTFEIARERLAGLACRNQAGWRAPVTASIEASAASEYRTASSGAPMAVLMAVDSRIKGDVFTLDQERAARARGWRDQ